jgi:S-formylglutathione hydrolase FrmB
MSRPVLLTLVAAALPIASTGSARALPPCNEADAPVVNTRVIHESINYRGLDHPFVVLVPPGYATSTRRYPVLFLLHGGTGQNHDSWLARGGLLGFTETLPDTQQAIVVMPDGGYRAEYADWDDGVHLFETFQTAVLPAYIDAHYRTLGSRDHRAIAGLSSGAAGALAYAARHPDLFAAAGGFSGAYAAANAEIAPVILLINATATTCDEDYPADAQFGPAGNRLTREVAWRDGSADDLATNLGGVTVFLSSGDGLPCDAQEGEELASGGGTGAIEALLRKETIEFDATLTRAGVAHETRLGCGTHNWAHWSAALRAFWPVMLNAFGTPPPAPFDVRRATPEFSAWGWDFAADPGRAAEFLDVTDASAHGFGITGSGMTTVTTASLFVPDTRVVVSGALERDVTADHEGRIHVVIDPGSPHQIDEYTAPARVLATDPEYFRQQIVTFDAVPAVR